MNFRISVTHLRIGLLVANFALAGGLVGMAGKSMMDASGTVSTVRVFEPSHFEYSEAESFDTRTKRATIQPVADWIDPPPKPVVAPPAAGSEVTTDEPSSSGPGGPEYGGPGPLAEKWEYEFYIILPDAPRESFVRLRRKGTEAATPAAASSRARIIRGRRGLTRGAAQRTRAGAENELSFFVHERHIKDDEKDVEFLVDEATPEFLAYRTPDRLNTIYRLPHTDDSSMSDWGEREDLRLSPREAEEPAAEEGEEAPKKPKIQVVPSDWKDLREEEYRQIISGGVNSLSQTPNLTGSTIQDATPDEKKDASAGSGNTTVQRFSGGARQPQRMSNQEGLRQIGDALREAKASGRMTAEDERAVEDLSNQLKMPPKK